MSSSTRGFITTSLNPHEALNKVVHSVVQLCSKNSMLHPNVHPFRLKALQIASPVCFWVVILNDRDSNEKIRTVQVGYFPDTEKLKPSGTKILISTGSFGDSEYIIKSCLQAAHQALGTGNLYFQMDDFHDNFEGPLPNLNPNLVPLK